MINSVSFGASKMMSPETIQTRKDVSGRQQSSVKQAAQKGAVIGTLIGGGLAAAGSSVSLIRQDFFRETVKKFTEKGAGKVKAIGKTSLVAAVFVAGLTTLSAGLSGVLGAGIGAGAKKISDALVVMKSVKEGKSKDDKSAEVKKQPEKADLKA